MSYLSFVFDTSSLSMAKVNFIDNHRNREGMGEWQEPPAQDLPEQEVGRVLGIAWHPSRACLPWLIEVVILNSHPQ